MGFDYFGSFFEISTEAWTAGGILRDCISDYGNADMTDCIEKLQHHVNRSDMLRRKIITNAVSDCLPPFSAKSLTLLADNLQAVTDSIYRAGLEIYFSGLSSLPTEATAFAGDALRCCAALRRLLKEFSPSGSSKFTSTVCIGIQVIAEKGENRLISVLKQVYDNCDLRHIVCLRHILDSLYSCTTHCLTAATDMQKMLMTL